MGIEGVSYGGQLTDWLITQTNGFKAAIPIAGISNLISYNYMTYYNQYEEMEFGQFLHQNDLMNSAWERSALKHLADVHTRPGGTFSGILYANGLRDVRFQRLSWASSPLSIEGDASFCRPLTAPVK